MNSSDFVDRSSQSAKNNDPRNHTKQHEDTSEARKHLVVDLHDTPVSTRPLPRGGTDIHLMLESRQIHDAAKGKEGRTDRLSGVHPE